MQAATWIENEPLIRLTAFFAVFAVVGAWEAARPRRARHYPRRMRWTHNLGLLLVDVVVLRLIAPGAAIGVAMAMEARGGGVLAALGLPGWLAFIVAFVLLDATIYFQHLLFHSAPTLWRLHRVHHADLDFDVTTGTRFHPFEILISTAVKCLVVVALGAPAVAVLVFELLLNATAMFNHANASLPSRLDRFARWFVVTPDMHRIHHSVRYNEAASNFGFNLPWWDRLFGTYRVEPLDGQDGMTIGVDAFREPRDTRLDQLLIQPFLNTPGGYAINRRPEPSDRRPPIGDRGVAHD